MKEFIEKLIERLEEQKTKYREIRKNTYCRRTEMDDCDYCRADHYLDARLEGINKAKEIANELAEEYNNDFCEWKWGIDFAQVQCRGDRILFGSRRLFTYCPYCGKKIKAVE